jgi:hypothetical protein
MVHLTTASASTTTAPVARNDPLWGRPLRFGPTSQDILTAAVDSVIAGTQEERLELWNRVTPGGVAAEVLNRRLPLPPPAAGQLITLRQQYGTRLLGIRPFRIEDCGKAPGFARPNFLLQFRDPNPIEALFNDPAGLRGQYFCSPGAGDVYTKGLIQALTSLLGVVMDEWREFSRPHWLVDDGVLIDRSLQEGKVWLEPSTVKGTLYSQGVGNPDWVPKTDDRAQSRRHDFLAQLLTGEQGDQAAVDDFLREASGDGGMGPSEALVNASDWSIQNTGAQFMGASRSLLQVSGAFVNSAGAIYTPPRKKHRALSICFFGYT